MKTPQIRLLGKVVHISESGLLIVEQVDFVPPYGGKVVTETIEQVGIVHRILGPVKGPFVGVKITYNNPEELIGKKLFVIKERKSKKRGKRGRKRRGEEKVKPSDD